MLPFLEERKHFYSQCGSSRKRKIEWQLTFEQWHQIWLSSGKFHLRGRGLGKYCMCRYGDVGPYSIDNVYIDTIDNNCALIKITKPNINDYRKIAVVTPLGQFASIKEAAKAHNITPEAMGGRLIRKKEGHFYV
jgi:hypothetical protein